MKTLILIILIILTYLTIISTQPIIAHFIEHERNLAKFIGDYNDILLHYNLNIKVCKKIYESLAKRLHYNSHINSKELIARFSLLSQDNNSFKKVLFVEEFNKIKVNRFRASMNELYLTVNFVNKIMIKYHTSIILNEKIMFNKDKKLIGKIFLTTIKT